MDRFFIKQNSTLPELIYPLQKTFFDRYYIGDELIKYAVATFSMIEKDTGIYIIANSIASFEIVSNPYDISNLGKYLLKYRFKKRDTTKYGHFLGEFKVDFLSEPDFGKITIPSTGKIDILISPSITKTTLVGGEEKPKPTPTTTTIPVIEDIFLGYLTQEQGETITESIVLGDHYPNQVMVVDTTTNHPNIPNTINCFWKNEFSEMNPFEFYIQYLAIKKSELTTPYQTYENLDFSLSKGSLTSIASIEELVISDQDYWVFKLNPTGPVNYQLKV